MQPRRLLFGTILASTMGAATFALAVFGVFAAELIAEFDVARWQVGALVTASSLAGAVVSPWLGGLADRIGARRATIATLAMSGLSLGLLSGAGSYLWMAAAAGLTGLAQAGSNPATNKLISLHVPPGRRGVITGIKQSGVQFGTFLGGLLLPVFARWWGWRGAVLAFVAVPTVMVVSAWIAIPPDPVEAAESAASAGRDRLPPFIRRVTLYGFLLGAGGSAIFTYLPLYGQEELGLSQAAAAGAIALTGFVGIVARIAWGRVAELWWGATRSMLAMALLAAGAGASLLLAPRIGAPLLWLAGLLTGVSASAWNTVGMLAVIQSLPSRMAGRGSGMVLLGFLAGLGLGAPVFGWSVDRLGSYGPGWMVVIALFALGWLVMRGGLTPQEDSG